MTTAAPSTAAPSTAAPSTVADDRYVPALLLVAAATGCVAAMSMVHFHPFTAYVTGTVILFGMSLALGRDAAVAARGAAIVGFALGALVGGRLVRRGRDK